MKTFKDLKVGDYVYLIFDNGQVKKYIIDSKEKSSFLNHFIYLICFKNDSWFKISLNECELNKSKILYQYQDPGCCRCSAYAYTTKEGLLDELFERKKKITNKIDKQIIVAEKL